jgi:redox-sensitive bicupin YhaK (pirin superfamily)
VDAGTLAFLTPGDRVNITAAPAQSVDVALLGGAPAEGDILFGGSFVIDPPQRLAQATADFASGKMGTLDGVPF